jgi:transketolase
MIVRPITEPEDHMNQAALEAIALPVRSLSMDAVQAANSGHPGLPMGCAEIGALLYGEILQHNPADPAWPNRDRFVLSAGHGSMFLYSLLHLSGYDLPLEELKRFRQIGSLTPGHPEYGHTVGVETTTGPLGQGIANAVGMAIAERMAAGTYNTPKHAIVDHYTYVLAGDGDMMEGIASEACSLAGHLGLGRLVVYYDDNDISIDGNTNITFTEDVPARFKAYGWHVQSVDGYDADAIRKATAAAREATDKPSLIVLRTVIGKGSPNKAGTSGVHGAALGEEEIKLTRKNLGLGEDDAFVVHPDAVAHFADHRKVLKERYDEWQKLFSAWASENPELAARWERARRPGAEQLSGFTPPQFEIGEKVATRKASGKVLNAIADAVPSLVGGSADLAGSNLTAMPQHGVFTTDTPAGRTINFGVREHGMAAISNGIALYGGFRPFCATFLVFSDYLRPSVRLSALMGLPVIYVLTHDSIFVGEDGPTHQPIEHNAALRTIPGVDVLRPGDAQETAEAWLMAIERDDGPSALLLTRQNLTVYEKADTNWKENMRRGAYLVKDCDGQPEVVLVATGSEVNLAIEAAAASSRRTRIVSMPSVDRFRSQSREYRAKLVPSDVPVITVEVGVRQGWEGIASDEDHIFSLDRFGASGPGAAVAEHLGFTAEALTGLIERA